jgi:hypothetical protein
MSDWENWEAEADKPVTEVKKDNKFADEVDEAVDIDAKPEVKVESKAPNPEKQAKKEKASQLGKKWDEKEQKYADTLDKKGPLTAEERKKAEQLSKESDVRNTVDLFGGFIEQSETQDLKTEAAYLEYAKKVAEILVKEPRKKYIQEFMKELLQQVYPKLTALEYEDIHSKCQVLFNQKTKDEKGPGPKGKKAAAPVAKLNTSKATQAAKLMDFDDEDDEEYTGTGGRGDNYDDFM